ncbi:MAG TPA: alginate export family protein [Nevskiaceae bacterium]|nr:alginate export family protein [Nevskiaceae bacterium]
MRASCACLAAGALLLLSTGHAADPVADLPARLAAGTTNVSLQVRYENVDQDDLDEEAEAATVRARLGYTTGRWNGLDAQLEYENVTVPGAEHFNSTENGRTAYPVVADPRTSEVNQAWIRWSGLPATSITYGRQKLVFDNQRFVGNVGWRQNEQTYDATRITTTWIPRVALDYAYITNVNAFRFFDFDPGTAVDARNDLDVRAHYVHAAVDVAPKVLMLAPYALLIDFDRIPAPGLARQDTRTLGLRATGAVPLVGAWSLAYALEYAEQSDFRDAPSHTDADYLLVEPALVYGKLRAALGYERLSGDGTYSLQTPLATLHAFQGWADQFLVTPADGIEDRYVLLGGSWGRFGATAVHHDYLADRGGSDYGSEIDLLITWVPRDGLTIGAKFAEYEADRFPVSGTPAAPYDTTKWWTWIEYRF